MGKLWQRAENTALNASLADIKDKVQSGTLSSAEFVQLTHQACDIAQSQSLVQTGRELKKLEKAPPSDTDLSSDDGKAKILRTLNWIELTRRYAP